MQGDSMERFMKVRQLAEEKAKEKINKLNSLLMKQKQHEEKSREYFKECVYERLIKAEKKN